MRHCTGAGQRLATHAPLKPYNLHLQLNAGSSDASGLAVRKSISPSGPFELGRHIVKLTISNPFHSASCSGTITVQVAGHSAEATCHEGLAAQAAVQEHHA